MLAASIIANVILIVLIAAVVRMRSAEIAESQRTIFQLTEDLAEADVVVERELERTCDSLHRSSGEFHEPRPVGDKLSCDCESD